MSRWKARRGSLVGPSTVRTRTARSFLRPVNQARIPGQTYTVDLTFQLGGAAQLSNAGVSGVVSIGAISSGQLAAYSALFGRYTINSVTYTFIPLFAQYEYNQATNDGAIAVPFGGQPTLFYIPQRDDTAFPTTLATAMSESNVRIYTLGPKPLSITETAPVFQTDANTASGIGNGDVFTTGPCDIDVVDLTHYAARWYVAAEGPGNPAYNVFVRLNVTFSSPR